VGGTSVPDLPVETAREEDGGHEDCARATTLRTCCLHVSFSSPASGSRVGTEALGLRHPRETSGRPVPKLQRVAVEHSERAPCTSGRSQSYMNANCLIFMALGRVAFALARTHLRASASPPPPPGRYSVVRTRPQPRGPVAHLEHRRSHRRSSPAGRGTNVV